MDFRGMGGRAADPRGCAGFRTGCGGIPWYFSGIVRGFRSLPKGSQGIPKDLEESIVVPEGFLWDVRFLLGYKGIP